MAFKAPFHPKPFHDSISLPTAQSRNISSRNHLQAPIQEVLPQNSPRVTIQHLCRMKATTAKAKEEYPRREGVFLHHQLLRSLLAPVQSLLPPPNFSLPPKTNFVLRPAAKSSKLPFPDMVVSSLSSRKRVSPHMGNHLKALLHQHLGRTKQMFGDISLSSSRCLMSFKKKKKNPALVLVKTILKSTKILQRSAAMIEANSVKVMGEEKI